MKAGVIINFVIVQLFWMHIKPKVSGQQISERMFKLDAGINV